MYLEVVFFLILLLKVCRIKFQNAYYLISILTLKLQSTRYLGARKRGIQINGTEKKGRSRTTPMW